MKNWVNIKQPDLKKARIEIIPMIDTIFFLLVFFMFTSLSMVQMKGLGVSIPKQSNTVDPKPPPKVVITVDSQGDYYLNTEKTDPSQVSAELQKQLDANNNTILIVNVAKNRPTQDLIDVMDDVNGVSVPDPDTPGASVTPAVTIATQYTDPGKASAGGS